ncbi:hypothetical protein [Clostridium sp. OS1-26]|nr:hypothetical protein [Clostridium sp. OS1-26]WML35590.1 hypothetical protein RCG18_02190 [Clostridium sp. OS1-26]
MDNFNNELTKIENTDIVESTTGSGGNNFYDYKASKNFKPKL